MPYLITTARPPAAPDYSHSGHVITRRAVATLEAAREAAIDASPNEMTPRVVMRLAKHIAAITEDGGTVGPLPDGTVIEVEPVSWVDFSHRYGHANGGQSSLDAFNAAHA